MNVTKQKLVEDLKALGVRAGDLLNVKASLGSIGFVEGGADTLVEALVEAVGPAGTIVTDSFVDVFPLSQLRKDPAKLSTETTPSYAGALANAMIRHPQSFRSRHPVQKFSAIGGRAAELMAGHGKLNYPYGVLKVMAEQGARNLKIGTDEKVVGVGTTHVAIGLLDYRQKRLVRGVNFVNETGTVELYERDWVGGCGQGFNNFIEEYRSRGAIINEGRVGAAPSKITDMRMTLDIELEILKEQPEFFKCGNPACFECRTSWDHRSNRPFKFVFQNMMKHRFDVLYQYALLLWRGKWYQSRRYE